VGSVTLFSESGKLAGEQAKLDGYQERIIGMLVQSELYLTSLNAGLYWIKDY
jgi:hypothetical protein